MDYFSNLIGQEKLKRKLGFYIDAFRSTQRLPFLLFGGARGLGKTEFMKSVGRNIKNQDGSKRPMLEINCSIFKNSRMFFENIFLGYINDNSITIGFDEFHNCPNDLAQALLTICNSGQDPVREFQYDGSNLVFDFTKLSFMFATTETDKIFPPLKDRFDVVDFESYTKEDMRKIVELNAEETVFDGGVIDLVIESLRGNARSCVKMAENITTYCQKNNQTLFGKKDWESLCYILGISPHGLTSSEIMVLKELQSRGPCSLNMLSSATGLSRTALQHETEKHLLKINAMTIDGKRKITSLGQSILKKLK